MADSLFFFVPFSITSLEYLSQCAEYPLQRADSNIPDEAAAFFYFPLLSGALILVLILTLSFVSPSVGASGTRRKGMKNRNGENEEEGFIITTLLFLQKSMGLSWTEFKKNSV